MTKPKKTYPPSIRALQAKYEAKGRRIKKLRDQQDELDLRMTVIVEKPK